MRFFIFDNPPPPPHGIKNQNKEMVEILDRDYHCPYLLNQLPFNHMKIEGNFQYFKNS